MLHFSRNTLACKNYPELLCFVLFVFFLNLLQLGCFIFTMTTEQILYKVSVLPELLNQPLPLFA